MSVYKKLFISALVTSFLAGLLFFCIYQEWLVIYWNRPHAVLGSNSDIKKKSVVLYRHTDAGWAKEQTSLLWSNNPQTDLKKVVAEWLSWLDDEQCLTKKVGVESIVFSPSGYEGYVSFDQNPFDKTWSIHRKAYFIKALLKTLHENGCLAHEISFLVHHTPLRDMHLDFQEPWTIAQDEQ